MPENDTQPVLSVLHALTDPAPTLRVEREERGKSRWIHIYGPERLYDKARYAAAAEARRWAKELGFTRAYWVSGGASFEDGGTTFRYSRCYGFGD